MAVDSWLPLATLLAADIFRGTTPAARETAGRRWCRQQQKRGRARKQGRVWQVHRDAQYHGRAVVSLLASQQLSATPGQQLPPGHARWSDRDRQRYLDTCTLLDRWRKFRAARPKLTAARCQPLFIHEHGAWARLHGLSCGLRSLRLYQRRLPIDGNVDRRGSGGAADSTGGDCAPEAWGLFRSLYLGSNGLSLAACQRFVAGEAARHNWTWPALSTIRQRVAAEIPAAAQTLARQGNKAFEAKHVPKMQRDYEQILAGEWWCLDGRVLDCFIRVPDERREWRRVRPVLTGVLDMRSRSLRIDVRSTESADGILAGIKRALIDWGAPLHAIADNGRAYKAAAGTPRGTNRQRRYFDDEQLGSVFAQLGVQVHNSIPYHAWAKQIESIWNKLKTGFDQWCWHFWGGTPAARPEGRDAQITRRIDELPTLAELRELLAVWLEEYHATAQSGQGTRGLAPNLVMEQYRAPVRQVSADLAALLCTVTRGPVKVRRDGVRYNQLIYGQTQEEVWRWQGRQVWLRVDPERVDQVTLCDQAGTPLVVATNERLSGASQEDRREAHRKQARFRRLMRECAAARDYVQQTPTQQILTTKRSHAVAAEAAQRKQLPAPEVPAVHIVRPDLTHAAEQVAAGRQRRQLRRQGRLTPSEQSAYDLLAAPRHTDEDVENTCQADLLVSFGHAG